PARKATIAPTSDASTPMRDAFHAERQASWEHRGEALKTGLSTTIKNTLSSSRERIETNTPSHRTQSSI
ncbi:hypothetical protein, partial [Corynebacterium durum]|uniref:hypothetical protein n=1 Tax=Corynebacterium durum TaxID=61592 RepID=UPI0028EA5DA5